MFRKSMTILIVVLLSLATAIPALAHAPAGGIVVEGVSVPGVAIGDTRAQVQAAYGDPFSCTSGYNVDDDATCRYPVEGFADHLVSIWINFRGPDGGLPSASPDDVVSSVSWQDSISGWYTQEGGINTEWARSVRLDPEAVLAVYPNAEITYGWLNNTMTRARDYELGITIEWVYHFYSGFLGVRMTISAPSEPPPPPPPPDPVTRVTGIELYANKIKGDRTVWASVWVDDEYWANAVGATVILDWTYPDGSTQRLQAVTNDSGLARYEMHKVKSGTHSIEVVDVIYGEHPFDRDYGTLTASVRVK
ncbi:MAG TPA: hypothetical protein VLA72_10955 [Anaerolineales bacterium]|nr:hypothetical protein [Anaerolineales bacterium]